MAFKKRKRERPRPRGLGRAVHAPARAGAKMAGWALRVTVALSVVATVLALALWLRLSEGPLTMPWAASMLAEQFNRSSSGFSVDVDDLELSLGENGGPAGLVFTGLRVADAEGAPLISVPRVSGRFDPIDLMQGRLRPTEISLIGAAAQVVREADGRLRFALDDGSPIDRAGGEGSGDTRRMDAVTRIVDGFVGDIEAIPALSRLQRVAIQDAELTYTNPTLGRQWRSERADLELTRTPHGALINVELDVISDRAGARSDSSIKLAVERRRGDDATGARLSFDGIRPEHLAEELPTLGWLALVEAPISGSLSASVSDKGRVGALSGSLRAEGGRVLAFGEEGMRVDRVALDFAYEPDGSRMRIGRLEVASEAAELDLSGFADLAMDGNALSGLAAQLDIAALRLALPGVFEGTHEFDDGQIVARVDIGSRTVEVAEARLRQGDLGVSVSGVARQAPTGWTTDLRIAGRGLSVDQLVGLWPLPAAKGARRWLADNLKGGSVTDVLAEMRLGRGTPELNLNFRFADLASSYLKEMSLITGASGRGHMTWDRLDVFIEEGQIQPPGRGAIRLAGSEIRILDLRRDPAPAEIAIKGRGPASAVLTLIDQDPLNFVQKLDLDPRDVQGSAVVDTMLRFPLSKDLKVADLDADTTAQLSNVRMPFTLKLTGTMQIAADRLNLAANTTQMTISGDITANGTPVRLDHEERYAGRNKGRDVRIRGSVTPAALRGVNINIPGFDGGTSPVDLTVSQAPGAATRLKVDADLTPAVVSVEPVFWSKPAGLPASVSAAGTVDDRLVLNRLKLTGPGLEAEGKLRLFPAGAIERAEIARLDMGSLADLAVDVAAKGEGFVLDIAGRWFDLAFLDRSPGNSGDEPSIPLEARYAVDQVRISEKITLGLVEGTFERERNGRLTAALNGRVAGIAPVDVTYERLPNRPGVARVTANDAGRVLEAAGLFSGAEGGRLSAEATIAPDAATFLKGEADIRNVWVRQEARTFNRVLEEGALPEAAQEARGEGLAFERVEVPFAFRGDRIEIGTALATSPSLAIKTTGVIDEATGRLNLRGVISPAYALTGILNNIPLIGTLLGGEGEGVLAMTFQVTGTAEVPVISVNPLTLLAPGFLRNIFEGGAFTEIGPAPEAGQTASRINQAAAETPAPPPRDKAEKAAADAEQAARLKALLEGEF